MLARKPSYDWPMSIELKQSQLQAALEKAYLRANSKAQLPDVWVDRARRLDDCPSGAAIAAFGAVLLARATDDRVDPMVVQAQEGSAGAFSLRSAASVLATNRRDYGFDIGSRSDRDPINAKTWINSQRWNDVLRRVRADHRPWIQTIIKWLPEVAKMDSESASEALAAFIRVRSVEPQPTKSRSDQPAQLTLSELVEAIDAFLITHVNSGATGLAVVAAIYKAAGFEPKIRTTTDPMRLDVKVLLNGALFIGCEVKQLPVDEATVRSLGEDVSAAGVERGHLAILPPGNIGSVDRVGVLTAVQIETQVMARITLGVAELLSEVFAAGRSDLQDVVAETPGLITAFLDEAGATADTIEAWTAIANRWTQKDP